MTTGLFDNLSAAGGNGGISSSSAGLAVKPSPVCSVKGIPPDRETFTV
jgi:hypothetical protein